MECNLLHPRAAWSQSRYQHHSHIMYGAFSNRFSLCNHGLTDRVSRRVVKHWARPESIDRKPHMAHPIKVQTVAHRQHGHNSSHRRNSLEASPDQMVSLHHPRHLLTFRKYPPARQRAIIKCHNHNKTAAHSISQTRLALHNIPLCRMHRALIVQTHQQVSPAHLSNTPQRTHLVLQTAYQYTTTSTAHTPPSHPAQRTALPSHRQNTAHPLHCRHTCHLQHQHRCASLHRRRKCPRKCCRIPFPRH